MFALGFSSCQKESSKAIVGTWDAVKMEMTDFGMNLTVDMKEAGLKMAFTFRVDGTGSAFVQAGGQEGVKSTFEYEMFGDTLVLSIDGVS